MPNEDGSATPEEIAEAVGAAARLEQIERENAARKQAEKN